MLYNVALPKKMETQDAGPRLDPDMVPSKPSSRSVTAPTEKAWESNLEDDDFLYSPLSPENYILKYSRLVQAEKEAHEGRLRERCIIF